MSVRDSVIEKLQTSYSAELLSPDKHLKLSTITEKIGEEFAPVPYLK